MQKALRKCPTVDQLELQRAALRRLGDLSWGVGTYHYSPIQTLGNANWLGT